MGDKWKVVDLTHCCHLTYRGYIPIFGMPFPLLSKKIMRMLPTCRGEALREIVIIAK